MVKYIGGIKNHYENVLFVIEVALLGTNLNRGTGFLGFSSCSFDCNKKKNTQNTFFTSKIALDIC